MTLQEQMLRFRAEHNISQSTLAQMCKLSVQTVNSIENGLQTPSKLTVAKIKMAMEGVTADEGEREQAENV